MRWFPSGAIACVALMALEGCATTYRPTQPRPAVGPGVIVDIVSIHGAGHEAEVSIRTERPTLIGPVSWSSADQASCTAGQPLVVGRRLEPSVLTELPPQFETNGSDLVFVNLGTGLALARPGLFIDFRVDTQDAAGCLRLPLTAAGPETLWQANKVPWTVSFGLRLEAPFGSLEGTGTRLALEARVLHPVGPVRAFFGFTFGGASCRGADCPPVDLGSDDDTESTGLFVDLGGEAGLERRFSIRRFSMSLTLGGSIAIYHLGAPPGYTAGQQVGLGGPFASLTLFGPKGDVVPGFSPAARRGSSGPEFFVARQTAFGRGPTESAWVAGFGWRIEGTN